MSVLCHIHELNYRLSGRQICDIKDLAIHEGDIIQLSGPSGEGKSLIGKSICGFFAENGDINYNLEFPAVTEESWTWLRRNYLGYIFQQPRAYFNPVLKIINHIKESAPESISHSEMESTIINWSIQLNLPQDIEFYNRYAHEYSIGQLQRIYILIVLIRNPKLIIADEPFAHLDSKTASQIGHVLQEYVEKNGAAILLISHERRHHFLESNKYWYLKRGTLKKEVVESKQSGVIPVKRQNNASSLIQIQDVHIELPSKKKRQGFTISGLNLTINKGERVGVMGNSGSGKSTLACLISGLISANQGEIKGVRAVEWTTSTFFRRRPSNIQIVFQDPYSSFHSSSSIANQVFTKRNEIIARELARKLGLGEKIWQSRIDTLSGGELQRVALVRALAVEPVPELLILDESFSALDIDSQSRITEVINQDYRDLAILLVSHRIEQIRNLCHRLLVIDAGRIVFDGNVDELSSTSVPQIVTDLIDFE